MPYALRLLCSEQIVGELNVERTCARGKFAPSTYTPMAAMTYVKALDIVDRDISQAATTVWSSVAWIAAC